MGKNKGRIRELSQAQRERLAAIEFRAFLTGEVRRADIEARFGVKPAASTRDLGAYRELAPANLDYDPTSRCYRPTPSYKPLFELSPERVLAWLRHGFGDGLDLKAKSVLPCESSGSFGQPDLTVLGVVTRALCAKRALKVEYRSLRQGPVQCAIVPVALADNGTRWHVRAFDRSKERFGDFVLTRIVGVSELAGQVDDRELLSADEQWARIVEMELVPHPDLDWPECVVADYGMQGGRLRIKARAALAGYVLRRWSVDASPDHCLDPLTYPLWLSNPQTLYGVESAALAPGYARAARAWAAA